MLSQMQLAPLRPGASDPAPDELMLHALDVPNRLVWRLLPPPGSDGVDALALSRLTLHPTWRGPLVGGCVHVQSS